MIRLVVFDLSKEFNDEPIIWLKDWMVKRFSPL